MGISENDTTSERGFTPESRSSHERENISPRTRDGGRYGRANETEKNPKRNANGGKKKVERNETKRDDDDDDDGGRIINTHGRRASHRVRECVCESECVKKRAPRAHSGNW